MLWGSRFDQPPDELFTRLNNSFHFDWRLYDVDIRGSMAYANALARAGIIAEDEARQIEHGLAQIRDEFTRGEFVSHPGDEDIHTAVERRLYELVGGPAHKLHTGRSRNDQVATDTRLYVMDAARRVDDAIRNSQVALVERAEQHFDLLLPGYTHLRRAQPILFSHYLLSFFWMLERDRERFANAQKRASVMPLGAGALAGNPFALDREFLARELGFERASENSLDAVSDRDFIAEFLFAASLLQIHLSRLAEDLILYSSAEFGFIELGDAYTSGSSLMPQKKNPDALELARAKSGRVIGDLTTLLVVLKGTPSTYDKDFQEDKEPLFDAIDTLELMLPVVAGVIRTLRVNAEKMRAALDVSMLATDLADYLVRRGVPFRKAHHLVGALVRTAEARGVTLAELPLAEFTALSRAFDQDVFEVFDFERSVERRAAFGGTAPHAVRDQIERARERLSSA
jgi:argininosuccinate lyase